MQLAKRVLVIAEPSHDGAEASATLGAATLARQLCQQQDGQWWLFAAMSAAEAESSSIRQLGATALLRAPEVSALHAPAEQLVPGLRRLIQQQSFDVVIAAATSFGRDLMPRLAGALDAAYVGDCTGIRIDTDGLLYSRPLYAGVITARCAVTSPTVLLTVRTSEFVRTPADQSTCPIVSVAMATPGMNCCKIVALHAPISERPHLSDARVVVAGGRPLGALFFDTLGPLADAFGGALAATRALCDAGHAPTNLQVGQTGKIVAPELYFAVGVSGSIQHVAGMRNARTIVAINSDPNAPIFGYADFGFVGDLFQLVPELVEAKRRRRAVPAP